MATDICQDNCFEWLTGQKRASVTFSQKRFVNKLKKYAGEYPGDIEIVAENEDGSICAHVPVTWFKFSPPRVREMSDEERAAAAERLKLARSKKSESV